MAHIFKILAASEFLSNMLFSYHLLYFCTAPSLVIMLSSHYHLHNSKTLSQLTQCRSRALYFCFIQYFQSWSKQTHSQALVIVHPKSQYDACIAPRVCLEMEIKCYKNTIRILKCQLKMTRLENIAVACHVSHTQVYIDSL